MAMLAEPRRKQKVINLRAKNNAWSNDSTKFGQRMLEKMGWKSGKGLGAHENGITEHVVARYKNDEKGLGFEDKNDQWTKHEDDFNALLANLSNASDNVENLHSGVSLEDKSKKSKARIHYHKFTRGKDISRYSEKDLANIFGKKSFKSFKETEVVADPVTEDLKTTEQVFTVKGSMNDYFKNKLAALKSKSSNYVSNVNNDVDYDECDYAFRGFSQHTDDDKVIDSEGTNGFGYIKSNECSENNFECDSINIKKKKKKSKKLDNENNSSNDTQQEEKNIDQNQECIEKIKKKKKSKDNINVDLLEEIQIDTHQINKKKKKSKNKDIDNDLTEFICAQDQEEVTKKKKTKIKESTEDIICNNSQEEIKKGKKSKRKNSDNIDVQIESITEVPKKKSKKRKKEL